MESTNAICKQIEESLDAFHDGELTATEQVLTEEHLQDCSACIKKLAEIQRLVHSLKAMPRLQVSDGLSSKLDQIVDRPNNAVAFRPKIWMPVAAAAAVLAIAFGVRSGLPGTNDGAPTVAQSPQMETQSVGDPRTQVAAIHGTKPGQLAQQVPPIAGANKVLSQGTRPSDRAEETVQQHKREVRHNSITATADHGATQVASVAPDKHTPVKATVTTSYEIDNEQIAELPATTNSFTDAVGFATDEDGLYDIKM